MNAIDVPKVSAVTVIGLLITALLLHSAVEAQSFPEAGDFQQGAKSWAENCSRCHNMRDPQDLRDDQWITTAFHMRVRAGLTGKQTRDILTFMQVSNSKLTAERIMVSDAASAATAARSGSEVYGQTCFACHGNNGKGTVPGAPDLTNEDGPLAQSDDVLIQHITGGFKSPGSAMAMPPKGGDASLTQAEIRAVLGYMRDNFGN